MTRTQAAVLPLSLSAHAVGVAGLLAVSILPAPLPLVRATPAPPPLVLPLVATPILRNVVLPRRAQGLAVAPRRAAPPTPSRRAVAPAVIADPPSWPIGEDERIEDAPTGSDVGVGCLGCAIGAVPTGGPGGDAEPGGGVPLRVGGLIREPVKLRHVSPAYPEIARAARVQGLVVLECTLTPEGRVANLKVVSGHPLLTPGARRAVEEWLYQPTLLNGVPVPVILTVTVNFALR